jgi:hypothetical protein
VDLVQVRPIGRRTTWCCRPVSSLKRPVKFTGRKSLLSDRATPLTRHSSNAIPEHPSQSRCQGSVVTHALSYSTWRRCGSCRGIGHSSRARRRSGTPIVANHSPERHLGVDRQAERAWLAMQASSDTACWSASTPLGRGRGAMLVDVDIAEFGGRTAGPLIVICQCAVVRRVVAP